MSRGGGKHPPKKKHENRPRRASVEPLSDVDRATKAQQEFDKAMINLIEAERIAAWGDAPNACVHSAYYAMHHCAAAAILASGGVGKRLNAPPSHEHVIQEYGKLVEGEQGDLGESGKMLSRARTDRVVADYDLDRGANNTDARATTIDARKFVDANAKKWGFNSGVDNELKG
jgi:uncharacterized protein (UPF0332 family)